MKKQISEEQKSLVENINDKLELKINLLKKDVLNKKNDDDTIKEGELQKYILDTEEKIKKNFDNRLNKIQGEMEQLSIKLVLLEKTENSSV